MDTVTVLCGYCTSAEEQQPAVFRFMTDNHWFLLTLTKIGFLKADIQQHHSIKYPQLPGESEGYTGQALRGSSKSATVVDLFLFTRVLVCALE
jgi:hypothetical protein